MDFSRIPFTAGFDRLGHLLPIGAFVRIATIQPRLQAQCRVRRFDALVTNRSADGPVALEFNWPEAEGDEDGWVSYETPEAVLNRGAVECQILTLRRTDELPAEAIVCTQRLELEVIEREVLSFLDAPVQYVNFPKEPTPRATLTLTEVCGRLRPEVLYLTIAWATFPDADDFTNFKLTRRCGVPLALLNIAMPTMERLLDWVRTNADFLARGAFCEECHVVYEGEQRASEAWLTELESAARPFCSHGTASSRRLVIFVVVRLATFYFDANCAECQKKM